MSTLTTTEFVADELNKINDIVESRARELRAKERLFKEKVKAFEKWQEDAAAALKRHADALFRDALRRIKEASDAQAHKVQSILDTSEAVVRMCATQKQELERHSRGAEASSESSLRLYKSRLAAEQRRGRALQQKLTAMERENVRLKRLLEAQTSTVGRQELVTVLGSGGPSALECLANVKSQRCIQPIETSAGDDCVLNNNCIPENRQPQHNVCSREPVPLTRNSGVSMQRRSTAFWCSTNPNCDSSSALSDELERADPSVHPCTTSGCASSDCSGLNIPLSSQGGLHLASATFSNRLAQHPLDIGPPSTIPQCTELPRSLRTEENKCLLTNSSAKTSQCSFRNEAFPICSEVLGPTLLASTSTGCRHNQEGYFQCNLSPSTEPPGTNVAPTVSHVDSTWTGASSSCCCHKVTQPKNSVLPRIPYSKGSESNMAKKSDAFVEVNRPSESFRSTYSSVKSSVLAPATFSSTSDRLSVDHKRRCRDNSDACKDHDSLYKALPARVVAHSQTTQRSPAFLFEEESKELKELPHMAQTSLSSSLLPSFSTYNVDRGEPLQQELQAPVASQTPESNQETLSRFSWKPSMSMPPSYCGTTEHPSRTAVLGRSLLATTRSASVNPVLPPQSLPNTAPPTGSSLAATLLLHTSKQLSHSGGPLSTSQATDLSSNKLISPSRLSKQPKNILPLVDSERQVVESAGILRRLARRIETKKMLQPRFYAEWNSEKGLASSIESPPSRSPIRGY